MRSRWSSLLASVLPGLLVLLLASAAGAGEVYENPNFGIKLRPPKGWTQMPQQSSEEWQVVKYLSDKTYFWTDKAGGWTFEFKPELTVVAFVTEVTRQKAEVERKKEDGKDTITILLRNPYKDYLDYLKRTYSGGGYYVSDEKDLELEGVPVHVYEIKVEKLARGGPKRIVTWLYKQPEVEFALQIEVFEDSYPKVKGLMEDAFKSFRLIPRTGGGLPGATTGEKLVVEDTTKLTPKQREKRRRGSERKAQEKALKTVPDGWDSFRTKRFLVLYHTDEKFARRIAGQAESLFAWLEATFPFVGPDEYVRCPVLRICKDSDEYNAYWTGGISFSFGDRAPEVVAYNDQTGFQTGWAVERLNQELSDFWFHERDSQLAAAMPTWLVSGLLETLGNARCDKTTGKMEFRADEGGRDEVRQIVRSGTALRPRELIRQTSEDFMGRSGDQYRSSRWQSGAWVFYLTAGAGAKDAKTKELLSLYIRNLKQVVVDREALARSGDKTTPEAPKTEEEEEARFKERSTLWRQRQKELLDETYERTFRSWTDKQWDAIEQAYFKTLGVK
ncbi:MAG: hypothetical protein HZA52_14965 [Planctomycetes bacterium]|nr:hypothetical protein [Planctomycetota bacterium]